MKQLISWKFTIQIQYLNFQFAEKNNINTFL